MSVNPETKVFTNPLIFRNIFSYLGRVELFNIRSVSKSFDEECVRQISKRCCGPWIHGKDHFDNKNFQTLLRKSRLPKLLMGNIQINGGPYPDSEFVQNVMSNAENVRILVINQLIYRNAIVILNACSSLVELRCLFNVNEQPDEESTDSISKIPMNLEHLSRLELVIEEKDSESQVKVDCAASFVKKIITASANLSMLSIQVIGRGKFSHFLKPSDSELTYKLMKLKTLHAGSDENHQEMGMLLSMVKNTIENLYLHFIWNEPFHEWPEMPKLTRLSLSNGFGMWDVCNINQVPNEFQAPNLKQIILGNPYGAWRDEKDAWTMTFNLSKESIGLDAACTRNKGQRNIAVVIIGLPVSLQNEWLEDVTEFFKEMNVDRLFVNMKTNNEDFVLKCVNCIPSLTRLLVRIEHNRDTKIMDIPLKKLTA